MYGEHGSRYHSSTFFADPKVVKKIITVSVCYDAAGAVLYDKFYNIGNYKTIPRIQSIMYWSVWSSKSYD